MHFSNHFFFGYLIILTVCTKHPNMIRRLVCGLRSPDVELLASPILFINTINSERYCSDILHAFIGQMISDDINYSWFQQNGATAHTSGRSMHLSREFFGDRIISKDVWPVCSPDLNPPDFYLWGAAKSAVYRDRPRTLDDIQAATNSIHSVYFKRATDSGV